MTWGVVFLRFVITGGVDIHGGPATGYDKVNHLLSFSVQREGNCGLQTDCGCVE